MRSPFAATFLMLAAASASPAAEQWSRLTSPNFEVYTDSTQKEGRDLLTKFEQVRSFFLKAAPVRATEEFPVRIVAFRSREEYGSYSQNPLSAAFFTSNGNRDYIVLSGTSPAAFSLAVHEYTHLVVRHSGLRLPLWLSEGWADVFSNIRPVSGGIAVGDLVRERAQVLESGAWMDLDQLTTTTQNSPEYHEANRAGLFYSESWALAHMMYLSPEYKANFPRFLDATHRGKPFAEAALSAFGKPSAEISDDLRNYLKRKKLFGQVFEVSLDKAASKPEFSPVADFDSRLVLADLLAVSGATARAAAEYEALASEQPNRADIALSRGYLALERKDKATALQQFRKAFAAGTRDARMCFELAALEQEANAPASRIILLLERAVEIRPDYTEAHVTLGLIRLQTRDYERTIEELTKAGTISAVAAPAVLSALAYASLQTGHLNEARGYAANLRKHTAATPQISAIATIETLIEARAASKFPPKPGEKLQIIRGTAQGMQCGGPNPRLPVFIDGQTMVFEVPETRSVELSRPAGNTAQLTCTIQPAFPIVVEFASPNIVRRIEF